MTRQVINNGTVANDDTGDSLRTAAQKINQNFGELYNKFGGDSNFISAGVSIDTNSIIFEGTTADAFETILTVEDPTTIDRTVIIPNASGNLVLDTNTVTLTNKSLTSPNMTTPTISDVSQTHVYDVEVSELSADRTITLPLLTGNDTFVFNNHSATLTNKTLVTPIINSPNITGTINDTNGAEIISLSSVASAVNNIQLSNATTGNAPTISAVGSANVDLELEAAGTGAVYVMTKIAYNHETKTAGGAISQTKTYSSLNSGSGQAATLANGNIIGQIKKLTNKGAGTYTITPTSFAQGTSFTLTQNGAAELIWDGSNWFLVNDASAYITIT